MDAEVYAAVEARAGGRCECCREPFSVKTGRPTADHFFGRAKAEENPSTVWLIGESHHRAKTDNHPSGEAWTRKFIVSICRRVDDWTDADLAALDRALAKLQTQRLKRG